MLPKDAKIFSADDHINEPPNLWQDRVPAGLRDKAPHVVRDPKEGDCWVVDGVKGRSIAMSALAGLKFEEFIDEGLTYDTIRKGGFDPSERLKDMDTDGLEGTVMYGGNMAMRIKDPQLRLHCVRAYNDWMAEFCSVNPKRLVGVAMIPVTEPDEAPRELRRAAKIGLKGALIEYYMMAKPVGDPAFYPLWEATQELDIPLSFHISGVNRPRTIDYMDTAPGVAEAFMATIPLQHDEILATLIYSGVLQEFPKLKVMMAEGGIGWLPYLVERMDVSFRRRRYWAKSVLKEPPSEFFKRNIYASFMEDKVGVGLRHTIGLEKIMWSSDYPHGDTTWPNSLEYVKDHFGNVPEGDTRKIIHDNAVKLFGVK